MRNQELPRLFWCMCPPYYNKKSPGPALVSSETDQGALEQATGRVPRLRIEGPYTEGYCWIRIQN